jgi:uncharacterized protein (TIGR03067 family)
MLDILLVLQCVFFLPATVTAVEFQRFQGEWTLVSWTKDGESSEDFPKGTKLVIKGRRIHFDATSDYLKGFNDWGDAIAINPFTRPASIALHWSFGIYEFKDARLKICVQYHGQGVENGAGRHLKIPEDFEVKKGQERQLWILERVKK